MKTHQRVNNWKSNSHQQAKRNNKTNRQNVHVWICKY